jgi:hypothetical protein
MQIVIWSIHLSKTDANIMTAYGEEGVFRDVIHPETMWNNVGAA